MQLIKILLIVVSVLTVLSGTAVLVGSKKKGRAVAFWFFLATSMSSLWLMSIAVFLNLQPQEEAVATGWVIGIVSGSLLMDVALLGFAAWTYKIGKALTVFFAALGAALISTLAASPQLLFSSLTLNSGGNTINFVNDWYFASYGTFIFVITMCFSAFLLYRIKQFKNKNMRRGTILLLAGLSVTGALALVFDLLMPLSGHCEWLWVGPLAIGITILMFYFAILRYKIVAMDSKWMKILSYVIIMASGAMLYAMLFYLVFSTMFRGSSPSFEVLALNFVMILIVLLLTPVAGEAGSFVKSLVSTKQLDITYIVKKLNKVAPNNANLVELAQFLADHLHFASLGFLIDGRLYGSRDLSLSADEIMQIKALKAAKAGVWQDMSERVSRLAVEHSIIAIAELRDAKGKVFGQLVVGRSLGKTHFEHKDLVQTEMIINLVAAIIDSKQRRT